MAKYKIAVDAGHGYNTSGKRTPDGEREWSFNNAVVLAITERLNQYGYFDILRTDDPTGKTDVSLADRVNKAIKFGADVFVSAHQNANAGKWGSHGGTETFYYEGSTNGKRLASLVQPKLIQANQLRNRGVKTSDVLYVLRGFRNVKTVAILTEGAFMDSTTDIKVLRDNGMLKAQGYAIADGIAEYFGVELNKPEVKGVSVDKSIPKVEVKSKTTIEKEVDELEFSSPTLKEKLEMRVVSPATKELLVEKAVAELGYKEEWKTKHKAGQVLEGDYIAMAYELAVYYSKHHVCE